MIDEFFALRQAPGVFNKYGKSSSDIPQKHQYQYNSQDKIAKNAPKHCFFDFFARGYLAVAYLIKILTLLSEDAIHHLGFNARALNKGADFRHACK